MKLKPCPFCGGEARQYADGFNDFHWVECVKCRVETKAYDFVEDAIEAWNQRESMDRIVGTLENTSERVTREVVELYRNGKLFSEDGVEYLVKKVFSEAIKLIANGGEVSNEKYK